MKMEITRRLKFCAGHRLMNHGGKCENLHGHNYVVDVTVCGDKTDEVGRVVDFSVIKKLFKGWLDEHWDHGFILSVDDLETIQAIRHLNSKLYLLPENPTAENMASYLFSVIGPQLLSKIENADLKLTRVAVWETDETCAEVSESSSAAEPGWLESSIAERR